MSELEEELMLVLTSPGYSKDPAETETHETQARKSQIQCTAISGYMAHLNSNKSHYTTGSKHYNYYNSRKQKPQDHWRIRGKV